MMMRRFPGLLTDTTVDLNNNSLVTVNVLQGFTETVPDIGSQAIAETGRQAIDEFINKYTDPTTPGPKIPETVIIPPTPPPLSPELAALPVGILGAGAAGLYTALILDSLGIKYEIMEASGRTGGRLFTHRFSKIPGEYQYYVSWAAHLIIIPYYTLLNVFRNRTLVRCVIQTPHL